MPRKVGDSWERFGRRFILRLSFKRPEEKAVMEEFDRRSALVGKPDKEFLKRCLVFGYEVLSNRAIDTKYLVLSTNESNNTQKEHSGTRSPNESESVIFVAESEMPDGKNDETAVGKTGIPAKSKLAGIFGKKGE